MNVDQILETFNRQSVKYLMLGGMNFLLRHEPVLTFDVDLWIEDTAENRARCERALAELGAEWGANDDEWRPASKLASGWLERQFVYCMISPVGSIDIFRSVTGLGDWQSAFTDSLQETTESGVIYRGLSDFDMLRCQYALPEPFRKASRVAALEAVLKKSGKLP